MGILEFLPGFMAHHGNYTPRLTVVNNCADNAELLWKVTGNPQWDFLASQGASVRYTGPNQTGDKFYVFNLGAQGTASAQKTFRIPKIGASSGAMSIMIACTNDPNSDWDDCKIGAQPGEAAFGALPLYEPSFGCAASITDRTKCNVNRTDGTPLTAVDWFDLSAVNSFALPFHLQLISAASYNCSVDEIDAAMLDLASCPSEGPATMTMTAADQTAYPDTYASINGGFSLLTTDGDVNKVCASPGTWFSSPGLGNPANTHPFAASESPINSFDWYASVGQDGAGLTDPSCTAPGCGGPQTYRGINGDYTQSLPLTNYVKRLKELGYVSGYAWPYDDGAGDINCDQGVKTVLTLCPGGGQPYSQSNQWWYNTDPGTNACELVDGSTPGAATRYDSLFECQKQGINKYKLIRETLTSQNPSSPYDTQDIYYCTTYPATDATTTYGYDACQTNADACNAAALPNGGALPAYCPSS